MAINFTFYGTEAEADEYFSLRLHSCAWEAAKPLTRRKALIAATRILNTLRYKGVKNAVHVLLPEDDSSTVNDTCGCLEDLVPVEDLKAADLSQPNQFPRGSDTVVPCEIVEATYEIAYALLDGKDPDMELEALGISSQGIESVRTTYSRAQIPIEHIINGVPSPAAWRLIRPYLFDDDCFRIDRV